MKTQINQTNLMEGKRQEGRTAPPRGDRGEDGKAEASERKRDPAHSN